MPGLVTTPINRNLRTSAHFLGLEIEDLFAIGILAVTQMIGAQFLLPHAHAFGLPLNWFLFLLTVGIGVPGLSMFKYGKPRGYLGHLIAYQLSPKRRDALARDTKITAPYLKEEGEDEDEREAKREERKERVRARRPKEPKSEFPSMAELLPIHDFLDNVMIRRDGKIAAGYRLRGALTYYGSGEDRNALKEQLDALIRTIPEESMRVQVRYEVSDQPDNTIDRYVAARKTDFEPALALDYERERVYRERAARGDFLARRLSIYFIWDPQAYRRNMVATGSGGGGIFGGGGGFPLTAKAGARRGRAEHEALLATFEAILKGIESSMTAAGLGAERITHDEWFNDTQDALGPFCPVRARLRKYPEATREISVREQLTNVSLYDKTTSYLNIDRVLWSVVTLKAPPERTYPGILRDLQTLGFPIVVSSNTEIPNQAKVLKVYQRKEKKMISAQVGLRGQQRVDQSAAQTQRELAETQARILASASKLCHTSLSIAFRTSFQYQTDQQKEEAEKQILSRRAQIMNVIARMDGAVALPESLALEQMLIGTLPGLAKADKRDHEILSAAAADLMPVEMPWAGTPRTPTILFTTPYRQLIPFSPFDPTLENANAIIAATSGAGKSMLVQIMLMTLARENVRVSILERGDSYYYTVKYMGGEMLTMSLDSDVTINPFDFEPGKSEPTKDQLSYLRGLVRHMIGDKAVQDSEILDNVISTCIQSAYERARMRSEAGKQVPLLSDVRDDLQAYIDPRSNELVMMEAHTAAVKLGNWVGNGIYAGLFDRYTTVDMQTPWLYFNIEKLSDDERLENAMSMVIAYATTVRAKDGMLSCVMLDECWKMTDSPSMKETVESLFRTARKRNACVWGISQAVEDFTGTPDKPKPIGGAILATTSVRLIGRQKGNLDVMREFLHLSPAAIEKIKTLSMTEKGRQSEFLVCIGERAETTHSLYVQPTGVEYWLATSFPRERRYRAWWYAESEDPYVAIWTLAAKYPHGLSELPDLPEEISGEVNRVRVITKDYDGESMILTGGGADAD